MYHFSRAIYRELAPYVLREKLSSQCESNQQRVLRECEAAIERLVIDHRHFARPASTLSVAQARIDGPPPRMADRVAGARQA